MTRVSSYLREKIIRIRNKTKLSYRKISAELLSEGEKVSKDAINYIVKKYKNDKMLVDKNRSGRPLIFKQEHYDYLDELISNDREIQIEEIQTNLMDNFGIRPSKDTIYRAALIIKWKKKTTR